jgi:hypothetical protein
MCCVNIFFFRTGCAVGVFVPASPQTFEQRVALYITVDTVMSLGNSNFQLHYNLMGPLSHMVD